ncbi:ABC transporter ATP-binding protein [Clostridium sp. KNHs205]|jgi:NitT/TauT family transport system ATP-binding protein|uniref:ABC transporter ATP-binding protein n=1 Tax=Clostridium sp. KNHs205 TaxID=1449050 RepID=UPI00068F3926|nr:ABC transporter ATP-binding protein [Clostridium sp. KNHs205]
MAEVSVIRERVPDNSKETKIELHNLSQIYKINSGKKKSRETEEFLALKDFSLSVKEGEFIAVVGPSGCGKSTLLDIVAGLTKPKSGNINIGGKRVTGPALDRGFVMQGYALFPWRTVLKNVEFGLELKHIPKRLRAGIAKQYISLVGLEQFEDRYPYELSGGMKQRVAIARALAYDPEVLLMDEPFAAVDAQTRENLQDELIRIVDKTNKTVIFVTHSIDEAVLLADRVVVMTCNPGSVKEIIPINLPKPRSNATIHEARNFEEIRHYIWGLLQNQRENNEHLSAVSE